MHLGAATCSCWCADLKTGKQLPLELLFPKYCKFHLLKQLVLERTERIGSKAHYSFHYQLMNFPSAFLHQFSFSKRLFFPYYFQLSLVLELWYLVSTICKYDSADIAQGHTLTLSTPAAPALENPFTKSCFKLGLQQRVKCEKWEVECDGGQVYPCHTQLFWHKNTLLCQSVANSCSFNTIHTLYLFGLFPLKSWLLEFCQHKKFSFFPPLKVSFYFMVKNKALKRWFKFISTTQKSRR